MNEKIDSIRKRIDAVDRDILKAIKKRIELAHDIALCKKKRGENIYWPAREEKILRRVKKGVSKEESKLIENIFRTIISTCRSIQRTLKISYLGQPADFPHQAAMKIFGKFCDFIPSLSINGVFADVAGGKADYGLVPLQNSTDGIDKCTLDNLISSPLKIINEVFVPLSYGLISKSAKISAINKIYSHPSVFARCRKYLAASLPMAEKIKVASVSEALMTVKAQPAASGAAVIASKFAAEIYKLNILEERIEDNPGGYTRFLVLGKTAAGKSGYDKTSLLLALKNSWGALAGVLASFKKRNVNLPAGVWSINLTKIKSRLSGFLSEKGDSGNLFFAEFEGHIKQKKIRDLIKELSKLCDSVKILGSFPKGDLS